MSVGSHSPVPCLTTASAAPLVALEQLLLDRQVAIECWLREQWQQTPPPFYGSVDLRNAGFKLAPVDTNVFPGGFNNLNPDFLPLCIQAVQATVQELCAKIKHILLIPENHTRNMPYFENVATLQEILQKAGFLVRIGSLLPQLTQAKTITLPSGRQLTLEPITRQADKVMVGDFAPCLVLLNNDLSDGIPPLLENLSQLVMPPLTMGWSTRFKSGHFAHYAQVCQEFGQVLGMDPWLIAPLFQYCDAVDFMTREGEDCLIRHTESLLTAIGQKYTEYGIKEVPFVVIKSDSGTYGMSVMTIKDPEEIRQMNRKQRTSMAATKGGSQVTRVIIQEGVYSFETWGEAAAVAEPVVYMIGRHVVGGFYRVHGERANNENLNAPGANFEPLAFAEACNNPQKECCHSNRFYAYGVIARLALLASSREIKECA